MELFAGLSTQTADECDSCEALAKGLKHYAPRGGWTEKKLIQTLKKVCTPGQYPPQAEQFCQDLKGKEKVYAKAYLTNKGDPQKLCQEAHYC